MNKLRILPLALMGAVALNVAITACGDDDDVNYDNYKQWREANQAYFDQQAEATDAAGKPLYGKYTPVYNSQNTFLMRFVEDPAANADNLQPLYTSSATVNYKVHLYDGTPIDSGYHYTTALNSAYLISGWSEAVTRMHVGDTTEVILPYMLGYGVTTSGGVPPFSVLRFNLRLVDVPTYEVRP